MATEMITLKLDDTFLKEIDQAVKANRYQNRTEFIRNALREKLEDVKLKDAMIQLSHLKGASKKKTSERELENIREKVFRDLSKNIK
ncbi:ribbon-helix-helix protein, CopG family [Candidatus Woesearchaeota archaeon]|nr:ribbon-helix-helix protein, CopG family [Candidatus Woesearchaeota archaeon]